MVMLHVMLNMIRVCNQNKMGIVCFFTQRTSKLNTPNLHQAVMLPRLKIHSILNDKVSFLHEAEY